MNVKEEENQSTSGADEKNVYIPSVNAPELGREADVLFFPVQGN